MSVLITIRGAVQGVGFRPYIFALAKKMNMSGSVYNEAGVVKIVLHCDETAAKSFSGAIMEQLPRGAFITSLTLEPLADEAEGSEGKDGRDGIPRQYKEQGFHIAESPSKLPKEAGELPVILPDIGICDSCMAEMLDPSNRRFEYPLISCTACGPRFSIIKALPYDRERTSMESFPMCTECAEEYAGKGNNSSGSSIRHHAQTISCHYCGPQYRFKTVENEFSKEAATEEAVRALKSGSVVGLKGIGGFQLLADPCDPKAVSYLRQIKGREKKPFAVMFADVDEIRRYCRVSKREEELLRSSARPIVLLEKVKRLPEGIKPFCEETAAESRFVGAFLPSAGIHRLILDKTGPLIVSSANISDDPIITEDKAFCEAFTDKIAGVMIHDREILSPADDSVVYYLKETDSVQFVRRARGYAPLSVKKRTEVNISPSKAAPAPARTSYVNDVESPQVYITRTPENTPKIHEIPPEIAPSILAFGSDLKSAFALQRGENTVLSQYFGDIENCFVKQNFTRELERMTGLFSFKPDLVVCDAHPMYISSSIAEEYAKMHGLPLIKVQHHHAHAASVMAEEGWESAIGVVFDGTGYGDDGALWGGEFLYCRGAGMKRMGQLKYVNLCGGDRVSVDASLSAVCYGYAAENSFGENFGLQKDDNESRLIKAALDKKINTIRSSSMGRLFDAVAAILGVRDKNSYEGECAIALENCAAEFLQENPGIEVDVNGTIDTNSYSKAGVNIKCKITGEMPRIPVFMGNNGILQADQTDLVRQVLCRHNEGNNSRFMQTSVAYEFHLAILDMVKQMCNNISKVTGERKVVLSGGVFANRILLAGCICTLRKSGFEVAWNRQVPSNDGGISLGQAWLGSFYSKEGREK